MIKYFFILIVIMFVITGNAMIPVTELSEHDVRFLGTRKDVLLKVNLVKKNIYRKKHFLSTFFDCTDMEWVFPKGYSRHVPLSLKTELVTTPKRIVVTKREDGNGFFPDVAANEVFLKFNYLKERTVKEIDIFKESVLEFDPDAIFDFNRSLNTIHLKLSGLFEFDFGCHNFGVSVGRLYRVNLHEKIEIMNNMYRELINDPVLRQGMDLASLGDDELNSFLEKLDARKLREVEIFQIDEKHIIFTRNFVPYYGENISKLKEQSGQHDNNVEYLINVEGSYYSLLTKKIHTLFSEHRIISYINPVTDITSSFFHLYPAGFDHNAIVFKNGINFPIKFDESAGKSSLKIIPELVDVEESIEPKNNENIEIINMLKDKKNLAKVTINVTTKDGGNGNRKLNKLNLQACNFAGKCQKLKNLKIVDEETSNEGYEYLSAENSEIRIVLRTKTVFFDSDQPEKITRAFFGNYDGYSNSTLPSLEISEKW